MDLRNYIRLFDAVVMVTTAQNGGENEVNGTSFSVHAVTKRLPLWGKLSDEV